MSGLELGPDCRIQFCLSSRVCARVLPVRLPNGPQMKQILLVGSLDLLFFVSPSACGRFSGFWHKLDAHASAAGTWCGLDDREQSSVDIMTLAIVEGDRVMVMGNRGVNIGVQSGKIPFRSMLNSVCEPYGR